MSKRNQLIKSSPRLSPASAQHGLYDFNDEKDACGIGFICSPKKAPSHEIVQNALRILKNLSHRSAKGADGLTGDGAGLLMQIPHEFFRTQDGLSSLPEFGEYAVGSLFFAKDHSLRLEQEYRFSLLAESLGMKTMAWRTVPTNPKVLGAQAAELEPTLRQVFLVRNPIFSGLFDWQSSLFVLRRMAEKQFRMQQGRDLRTGAPITQFYIASLSTQTIVYKGLVLPESLGEFFSDLRNDLVKSQMALVHSRFSTNTLPAWELAHPFRQLCHNGEINTIRGNLKWMKAREPEITQNWSKKWNQAATNFQPLVASGQSDSQSLDNVVEILCREGFELPEALMIMVPEAWEKDLSMHQELRDFYAYYASRMEPWDGPAAICFTDGKWVGARLDRNGLRPCRYTILQDQTIILSSETGVLDLPVDQVLKRGRLSPGEMLAVDMTTGEIFENTSIKNKFAAQKNYGKLKESEQSSLATIEKQVDAEFESLASKEVNSSTSDQNSRYDEFHKRMQQLLQFGFSRDELRAVVLPMFLGGEEPSSSMGNDTPLAVLSDRPQLLFNYFRQMFAQVTNPPIDPIREEMVMSLSSVIGARSSLVGAKPEGHSRIWLEHPVLTKERWLALQNGSRKIFGAAPSILSATWSRSSSVGPIGTKGLSQSELETALDHLCEQAAQAVRSGARVIVIADWFEKAKEPVLLNKNSFAIPSLLALSAVHQHLVHCGLRLQASLVVATGEARDVHHFACLIGYGADAVYPYLLGDLFCALQESGEIPKDFGFAKAELNFGKAINKGLLKVMSKMGISTLQSYCGAQIFEVIGLSSSVVQKYFGGTASKLEGMGIAEIENEIESRHQLANEAMRRIADSSDLKEQVGWSSLASLSLLPVSGKIHFRSQGESHQWTPHAIASLQNATKTNSAKTYQEFSDEVTRNSRQTLRGLLSFKKTRSPIALDEVEPATEIMRRFTTGAMSFGALSQEAHETLAIAMNRIGAKSNSGEGGEGAERFQTLPSGDSKNSKIKQVASARFGVTAHYLANAQELQIKIAQGAKPGEGGQLPGHKVDATIARLRHSTPGVTLISPPPHHDIYSIEDLSQVIFDLKNSNPQAAVSVKLVAEAGVGTIAAGVAKAHAEKIVIAGDSGGTGASPLSSILYAGSPWEMGLAEAHQTLVLNGLRGRVRLETDGQLKTGRDVAIAAMLGAEEFGFSTAPLIVEGCIMMRKCHLNTCPVGVATQDPVLRARFNGQPEHVIRYFHFVAEELRKIMSELGYTKLQDMIGRTDELEFCPNEKDHSAKTRSLDLSRLLTRVESLIPGHPTELHWNGRLELGDANQQIRECLDRSLLDSCEPALAEKASVTLNVQVKNTDRAFGTLISSQIAKRHGAKGLESNQISLFAKGAVGQSMGAFLVKGVQIHLEGEANDYVGKGLSGGRIVVHPPHEARFHSHESMIVGNTCLYGATSGEVYFAGRAGERFAVRNSGASAVVEGTGDHACEYMTGGKVIILGETGKNFAAGMSGGLAYVYDPTLKLEARCNLSSIDIEEISHASDFSFLKQQIEQHFVLTQSLRAKEILQNWPSSALGFRLVIPKDYRSILQSQRMVNAMDSDASIQASSDRDHFSASHKTPSRVQHEECSHV